MCVLNNQACIRKRTNNSERRSNMRNGKVRLAGWCCVLVMASIATVALAKSPASDQDLQDVRGMYSGPNGKKCCAYCGSTCSADLPAPEICLFSIYHPCGVSGCTTKTWGPSGNDTCPSGEATDNCNLKSDGWCAKYRNGTCYTIGGSCGCDIWDPETHKSGSRNYCG